MSPTSSSENKNLLVLAAAPGRLGDFERYMGNRSWNLRIRSDFKQLLADVVALKPRYVLVSLQAHHPNLQQIRSLLEQVYQIRVVDFSEEANHETDQSLRDLGRKDVIYGLLTGPVFEKFLLQKCADKVPQPHETNHQRLQAAFPDLMKRLFSLEEGRVLNEINWVSRLRGFRVQSRGVSGYFLAAVAGDRKLDEQSCLALVKAIEELCLKNGIEVDSVESFPVDSRRVHFRDWVSDRARFSESGAYRGHEIVVAFLEVPLKMSEVVVSADGKFVSLPLEEIQPDRRVGFDLHLSLPLNGKYVLYVASGSTLTFSQQLNLQSRKVRELHAKVSDRDEVLRDRMKRDVERSIGEFYENRAA